MLCTRHCFLNVSHVSSAFLKRATAVRRNLGLLYNFIVLLSRREGSNSLRCIGKSIPKMALADGVRNIMQVL
jgi:hypothetical protein